MMVENSEIKDHLCFAIHRICEALEKYSNASRIVHNKTMVKLLKFMAGRKKMHALFLHKKYRKIKTCMIQNSRNVNCNFVSNYLIELNLNPFSNMEDVFHFVLKNEYKNLTIFKKSLHKTRIKEVQKLFIALVEMQVLDIKCLKNELVRVLHDKEPAFGGLVPV